MLSIKNISKTYQGRKVIDDISLNIRKGEMTFIVGNSGAGKSTLLNMIGGLELVDSGEIIFDGKKKSDNLCDFRANEVGFIFQDFNLIPGLSVKENIVLGMLYAGCKASDEELNKTIKDLGILDANQSIETLSGGEKQRSAIARSVCKNSKIIIADEPTGNLDSENAINVMEMLSELKQDRYIIIVSHDLELAKKYADRIITLGDGHIVDDTWNKSDNDIEEDVIKKEIKKSSYSLKTVWMLGKNSVKKRFSRILSIAFVLALAVSALALVIQLGNSGENLSQNVNTNYLENDLLNVFYEQTPNTGYKEMIFSTEQINSLKKTYDFANEVEIYLDLEGQWFFNYESKISDATIKQINIEDYFERRVMSNDIEGRFLQNDDEIILASDIARDLFGEGECIGKKIFLNDGNGQQIECSIVGINHTKNPFDSIYTFISSNKIKELLELEINSTIYGHVEIDKHYTQKVEMKSSGIYGAMSVISGDEKIIYGSNSRKKNEILISRGLLDFAINGLLEEAETSEENINKLFRESFVLNCNGLFDISICGVYKSDEIEMRFSKGLIEELLHLEPIMLDIYASNPSDVTKIKENILKDQDFVAVSQLETLKTNVDMQTKFFRMSLFAISIIMIVIGIALLESFAKISVLERTKEIGIMKSLGAKDRDVMCTLWFDTISISLLEIFLSFMITGIAARFIPAFMRNVEGFLLEYPLVMLIVFGFFALLIVMFFNMLLLRKMIKNTPASLLKH